MANPELLAKLKQGVKAWNEWRSQNPLAEVDLEDASLKIANLHGMVLAYANLSGANLRGVGLSNASLMNAHLGDADLSGGADLSDADLRKAVLCGANLSGAEFSHANLYKADLSGANLSGADLYHANLYYANLSGTDMSRADCCSANLQRANLDGSTITDINLWETQRAGWSIKGILCERAYWDRKAKEPISYAPGEFERIYSEQTCIELFYQGGVSTFELNTLPALLYHLASLHPDSNIRLKSIEETGGGAKISINIGDASTDTAEKIKADAMQVQQVQLALRDDEFRRLQIENSMLNNFNDKLMKTLMDGRSQQNVFNAPVHGLILPSGNASAVIHQTVNDNSALHALLERMMDRRSDLKLSTADASKFEAELQSTTAELQKQNPDKSIVSRGVQLIRTFAEEAFKSAAGKLGEQAVSADWQSWLHQLGHFISHLN